MSRAAKLLIVAVVFAGLAVAVVHCSTSAVAWVDAQHRHASDLRE